MAQPDIDQLTDGVLSGHRAMLGRAISLVESTAIRHQEPAQELLQKLLPHTGRSQRVGISGVPGVGKSTFIEKFGGLLTSQGHKVAVLAVDPSSSRTGGSILGDKTRMQELSQDPNAFIRPSPSSNKLGGVTRTTRETMIVVEAAGFDVVIVETVGTGQSETVVADMVDFFLVLMLPGAGDELQGIKKGILEIADMIAVNKADGENETRAKRAAREYKSALHIMTPASENWTPPVLTCSGLKGLGLQALWDEIAKHREILSRSGEWQGRRETQQVRWMWDMLEDRLQRLLKHNEKVQAVLPDVEQQVAKGKLTPVLGVSRIFDAFGLES